MKANFALSLSFEGIRLLHRAEDGWRLVGEVALDLDDLPGALQEMRQTALEHDPTGFRTKLILPNEQIKYIGIETGSTPVAYLHDAAESALDGATPYAVTELAFDMAADGNITRIAAVAKETLAEAEAFAMEHGFDPICFVAMPDPDVFPGEPFFGPTQHALDLLSSDDAIERDRIAVVEIGSVLPVLPREEIATNAAVPPAPPPASETPVPHDLAGYEVDDVQSEPVPAADAPMPTLGGASRDLQPAPVAGVLSGSLPGSEPLAQPTVPPTPGSFVSRRSGRSRQEPIPPAPRPAEFDHEPNVPDYEHAAYTAEPATPPSNHDERQRMTVFGAREPTPEGGVVAQRSSRSLGMLLTAILILFLAGVAAWASVFLRDDGEGLSGFFAPRPPGPAPEKQVEIDDLPVVPHTVTPPQDNFQTVSLSDDIHSALDAPDALTVPSPVAGFDPDEAEAHYAITGIWTIPPAVPNAPGLMSLDNLYLTTIDRADMSFDAVALLPRGSFIGDESITAPANPAAPGISFALDSRGLVKPTPEGTMSPDGVLIFLGKPPIIPPATPDRRSIAEAEQSEQVTQANPELAAFRPRIRPGNLIENNERQQLGGLSRIELATYRPRLRPETTKLVEEADETPTAQAVAASYRPSMRPQNLARAVARAQSPTPEAPETEPEPTQVAAVAPRVVQPKIPSRSSVTKEATVRNAIRLNRINLMGVYGTPSNRRALVRLASGRYKKVKVGDRIDGGRVSAIGEGELRYNKGNRSVVLKMPKT